MAGIERVGYVDESYRFVGGRLIHVLGVVEPLEDPDLIRDALRGLPRKPLGYVHFRDKDDDGRLVVASAVGSLPLRRTAIVCTSEHRIERARGLSVERLVWMLHERVDVLVIESRNPRGDRHDASVVAGLRRRGLQVECRFAGKEEAMLWAADVVAGAVRLATEKGGDPEPGRRLGAVDTARI